MNEGHDEVRVRMAPGPTGPFHLGRSRTAVINWLFARHHGGKFILRIEDTDLQRSKPEHLQSILNSLEWLGLNWDEGPGVGGPYRPYFQMDRLETYRQAAGRLLAEGHAYTCYCTPEELDQLREQARAEHRAFRYPGTCRSLTPEEQAQREGRGLPAVLRLRMPNDGAISFDDMLLGQISIDTAELDDWVIMKSDGIPTYNFAVVIDDLTMHITHVIRGQEHIPNTPRQIMVYRYLDAATPTFGHLPMVLGMDRTKLSARKGALPVTGYADEGYLPEAIVNYLATIGASYEGEQEIFTRDELIEVFDIHKIGKSGAAFSDEKLEWMNGVYLRALPLEEFVRRSLPFLEMKGLIATPPSEEDIAYAGRALRLEQERVKTLAQTPEAVAFFFASDLIYDPILLVVKKSTPENASRVLRAALAEVDRVEPFTHDALEPAFRALTERLGLKTTQVFGTIRVAITGRIAAPPLFDTMEVLGRRRVRERLQQARQALERLNEPVAGV